jgi:hypothetical protein
MSKKAATLFGFIILICMGGCTNTRYLTDLQSIDRQHEMRKQRSGINAADILLNSTTLILSIVSNSGYEIIPSERAFKRIIIVNEFPDSLIVNMVTDIVWKETGYCDIMGIVLPPKARQKLLAPYPAAYYVYFKTPTSAEDSMEIRTDSSRRIFKFKP